MEQKKNIKNHEGWTPIHIACQYNNVRVIHHLIDYKADINIVTFENWNSLHIAIYYNNKDAVACLLEEHPNMSKKNNQRLTPVDMAIKFGNMEIIHLFEEKISEIDDNFNTKKLIIK